MCMINKISVVEQKKLKNYNTKSAYQKEGRVNCPNFKGLGGITLAGIQACERMPMVNVAVIDLLSAILPRTLVESLTNPFAGFEAFRRESSGLIVNCLIPSIITLGIAKCINNFFMPKGSNLSGCWADSTLIDKAAEYYKKAKSDDKVQEALREILGNIEGFDGKEKVVFHEKLSAAELDNYAKELTKITQKSENGKEVSKIANEIIAKTHIAENIKIGGAKEVKASSVNTMLSDSVKYFREFQKAPQGTLIDDFAKQSKKLVRTKSLAGLTIILPLAISMQYINRWITEKASGVKGAPIYDDFGKKECEEGNKHAKEGLLKQKIISISSMLGVSLLSMMKMPSMNMLEFKGMFPTMDQARIISTATFASRMAAADDKNELAEATVRDIATFSSLYFLGDYAAKGAATIIQNQTGVTLLNETKKLDKNANILQKTWHWIKNINIKSSEEVFSKTENKLKKQGKTILEADKKIIKKEIEHAKNLRSACQIANLGVSLALLGIIIPIFTRNNTKKRHAQDLQLVKTNQSQQVGK